MIKIGICGIGNAGNQIAALGQRVADFPAVAINSSERDIDAIEGNLKKIIFGSREGAGKNRGIAKQLIKKNIDMLIGNEELIDMINANDYIFIVSSAAGGTGSGTSPMITDILNNYYNSDIKDGEKGKVFINVGILPSQGESVGAQRNAIEYLIEMENLGGSYMLFDNDRVKGTTAEVFETINNNVIEALRILRGDYSIQSSKGMIDEEDTRDILTVPGMIFVDSINGIYEENIPVDGSIEDLLIDHITKQNCMVKVDRDKIVKRLGFISVLSDELTQYFDENLPKIRATYGEPVKDFKHVAVNEDRFEGNMLAVIMSGMSLPENRLVMIKNRIDRVAEGLAKKKTSSLLRELNESVSGYEGNSAKKVERKEFDLKAITGKY